MAQQIVFSILAVVTLVSALIVVTDRNLFHAAIAMMVSFLGVAGFYAMLQSGFMAAAQLLVYIGAISILMIFAIMMTRRIMTTTESPFNSQWFASLIASGLFCGLIGYAMWGVFDAPSAPPISNAVAENAVVELGNSLVSANGYVLPFELISILLLAALIGSIVVARPERETEEEVA